jgi:short chain dehydrogenase
VRCSVRAGQIEVLKIIMNFGVEELSEGATVSALAPEAQAAPARRSPVLRDIGLGIGLHFSLPLAVDAVTMAAAYPSLITWFGQKRVAALVLLSTAVGMEWPGENSLFTSAKIDMRNGNYGANEASENLQIDVVSTNVQHKLTKARVTCSQIVAEIEAFFRPPAVRMPTTASLVGRVGAGAFDGWTGIVVGGSRGLGEVAAKLMAAGSANIILTYRVAQTEAMAVMDDIRTVNPRCTLLKYDAADSELALPPNLDRTAPVLVFYSASPHIFRRRTTHFSRPWLDEFLRIYVDGMLAVVNSVKAWSTGPISVVFPSSQALDAPMAELIEYAAAKAAGEAVCQALASDKRLTIEAPRLPRLLTDQTNSIVHVKTANPVDVLLPILSRLTLVKYSHRS